MQDLEARLSKAKAQLILDHPFVGTVALSMPFELSKAVPTAATNGKRVLFNPGFIAPLTDAQVTFLVAHECLHPMLEHTHRRGARQPQKWNAAADFIINQLLTDDHIGDMPPGGLRDRSIYKRGGGTAEGVYAILPDEYNSLMAGDPGGALDECEDAPGDAAQRAQNAAEWQVRVAQAAQAARMRGKLTQGMARLVDAVLRPKVDWRTVLQRFLQKTRDDTRTFARFNRRFLPQGVYLPSVTGEALGELVFAIDCSGSIGAQELNQFAAEIRTVHEDMRPSGLTVMYFDSGVCHTDRFEREDTLTVAPHGGGGTAFSPVFERIERDGLNPVAVVFLTDLCCDDFGPAPDYPVLWVSTHGDGAPFGEVVRMQLD